MKREKVTISTLAVALSISPVSISRALSGQPGPGVSEELKDKIFKKTKEMGYLNIEYSYETVVSTLLKRISYPK